jgi:hypothetical protein
VCMDEFWWRMCCQIADNRTYSTNNFLIEFFYVHCVELPRSQSHLVLAVCSMYAPGFDQDQPEGSISSGAVYSRGREHRVHLRPSKIIRFPHIAIKIRKPHLRQPILGHDGSLKCSHRYWLFVHQRIRLS